MAKYTVQFYWENLMEVEADSEQEAEEKAYEAIKKEAGREVAKHLVADEPLEEGEI